MQGLKGQSQCGLEEVQEAMPLLGDSSWASFQSKKDLDEQRFMGFFSSGFGNIPKRGEKTQHAFTWWV